MLSNPVRLLHPQATANDGKKLRLPKASPLHAATPVDAKNSKPSADAKNNKTPAKSESKTTADSKLTQDQIRQICALYPSMRQDLEKSLAENRALRDALDQQAKTAEELVSVRHKLDVANQALRAELVKHADTHNLITSQQMEINRLKDAHRGVSRLNSDLHQRHVSSVDSRVPKCAQMMEHIVDLLHACSDLVFEQPDSQKELLETQSTVKAFVNTLTAE